MNEFLANSPAHAPVDGLLRSFFKREMPDPWPQADVSRVGPAVPRPRSWWGALGRAALVASLSLIIVGYLILAAKFPVPSEPGLRLNRDQTIGSKPRVDQPQQPTRSRLNP